VCLNNIYNNNFKNHAYSEYITTDTCDEREGIYEAGLARTLVLMQTGDCSRGQASKARNWTDLLHLKHPVSVLLYQV